MEPNHANDVARQLRFEADRLRGQARRLDSIASLVEDGSSLVEHRPTHDFDAVLETILDT